MRTSKLSDKVNSFMKIRELITGWPLREDDQALIQATDLLNAQPPQQPVAPPSAEISQIARQAAPTFQGLVPTPQERQQMATPPSAYSPQLSITNKPRSSPYWQPQQPPFPTTGTAPATNAERYVMNKAQTDAASGQPVVVPRLAGQP